MRQARQNIFVFQARVIPAQFFFRLPSGQQLKNEFNGKARAANHRLSPERSRARYDSVG